MGDTPKKAESASILTKTYPSILYVFNQNPHTMFKLISLLTLWVTAITAPTTELNQTENQPDAAAKIQVALLLDTSGSMDGLIEQAKSQLWKIVNELATSKKKGETPNVEIALYEYGKSTQPADKGYMKQIVPLTTDLDLVSEKLFELKTNGGSEYCGWAIKDATEELEWSASNDDLKMIFIAGNEAFTQGNVDYKEACKGAITNSIIVNTIFCGECEQGVSYMWKDGADRADGKYMCINQNEAVVHIETPYDADIVKLNDSLNKTYIAFGREGKARQKRQVAQDMNAKSSGGAANIAERAKTKSQKKMYNNASWDMVDAVEEDAEVMEEVEIEELPEEMKAMDMEERKAYVAEKSEERTKIQKEIQEISAKRTKYITEKRKEAAVDTDNTLDAVMLKTVREQAQSNGFKFEKK